MFLAKYRCVECGDPAKRTKALELLTIENLFTLAMPGLLQAVLGFNNLLYILLESKRVDAARQASVRHQGIGLAVSLRIRPAFYPGKSAVAIPEYLV